MIAVGTGGATGIGFGIARTLAANGARVAIVQPTLQQAENAARLLPEADGFASDVRDQTPVERMTAAVVDRFGGLDPLVNNAALTGRAAVALFLEATEAHVDEVLDVHLKGAIWCRQVAARRMIASGRPGNIIHIASVGAFAAQEPAPVYCASKAALLSLTRSTAFELAPHGIRVNAFAPDDILTEASTDVSGAAAYSRHTPRGRRGDAAKIGEAAVLFAGAWRET